MSEPWFQTTQRLRFNDNDIIGHVNNAVYATLFESGRVELMLESQMLPRDSGLSPVLVRLEIDFKRELSFPGDVLIETAVARFGTKSVRLQQRISSADGLAAEAVSVLVLMDRTARRSVPLDPALRERLSRWSLPGA